jgi:glycosyltransferase involved in cell wall biosynthesis
MINDCAFVGQTIFKHLPADIEKQHIKRTRGLWSKTFGLTYKILKAKGDLFHAHYLLQDCYLAARLGKKPLIGHAHGSDLRVSLKHPLWGRIVRHNLKNCNKILVSTPDILSIAKSFRKNAEYLPNPVDTDLFFPKPAVPHNGKPRVLIASDSNWSVKGTDVAIRALSLIKDKVNVSIIAYGADFHKTVALASSLGLHLNVLSKISHEKLNEYYWNSDVVIDRFKIGSLGLVSLEAIACGRPVLCYVSSEYPENAGFPLMCLRTEEKIAETILNPPSQFWEKEHVFVEKYHSPGVVVSRLLSIYSDLVE